LASEGNTEEENSGIVVFKLQYISAGNRVGVRGKALLRQHHPLSNLKQAFFQIFKDDVNVFPPLRILATSALPENILLALATGSSLFMLMCVFTRFPIFRVSLQTIESIVLDVLSIPQSFEPPRAFFTP
jgi:hypothetical protein